MTHDFLSIYDAKIMEYLLAVAYLLLFVPMWRYVQGAARGAEVVAGATAALPAAVAEAPPLGWFQVPDGVALHPGHAWARVEPDGLVAVGLDDFAAKLVDPEALKLPATGDQVRQSRPAFAVGDQVLTVPMLSPVDGTVVAVNAEAREHPERLHDPYGAGWLFKVRPPGLEGLKQLLSPAAARDYLEKAAESLSRQLNPALGRVLQDGGVPIRGIARAVAGDEWAALARRHFLTDRSEP